MKQTNTVFSWGIGGGFDVKLPDLVEYRPVVAEYIMIRPDGTSGKGINDLRLSTGIGFRFGSK